MEEKFESKFENAIKGIREYSRNHSLNGNVETDFEAYNNLINLGKRALIPLGKIIGQENGARWYILSAAAEIMRDNSDFRFPKCIRGDLQNMERYLSQYLQLMKEDNLI